MRIFKNHSILKLANSYLIGSAQPSFPRDAWTFGSLLVVYLGFKIVTGVTEALNLIKCIMSYVWTFGSLWISMNSGSCNWKKFYIMFIKAIIIIIFFFLYFNESTIDLYLCSLSIIPVKIYSKLRNSKKGDFTWKQKWIRRLSMN